MPENVPEKVPDWVASVPRPRFTLASPGLVTSERLFDGSSGLNPKADCFALKVVQSADVSNPRFELEALGILNTWLEPDEVMLKSVPALPSENN